MCKVTFEPSSEMILEKNIHNYILHIYTKKSMSIVYKNIYYFISVQGITIRYFTSIFINFTKLFINLYYFINSQSITIQSFTKLYMTVFYLINMRMIIKSDKPILP